MQLSYHKEILYLREWLKTINMQSDTQIAISPSQVRINLQSDTQIAIDAISITMLGDTQLAINAILIIMQADTQLAISREELSSTQT